MGIRAVLAYNLLRGLTKSIVELRYSMAPVAAAASRRLSAEYVAISVLRETVTFVLSFVASRCF